ncbi:MAG: hypothetical protein IJI41_13910 [Anaerolineaceae bacterium]|nr:hypothetical protein [Anaerolineaceae bacterium]
MCRTFPGYDAHAAGSDVPTVLRVHDAAADPSPSRVTIAVEAYPARSLCAFADAVGQWHLMALSLVWHSSYQRCLCPTSRVMIVSGSSVSCSLANDQTFQIIFRTALPNWCRHT